MYRYLFGPVPSRRLGMSLGVDLVPRKTCSLDCVYCEVGKTTELTCRRREYVPVSSVIGELEHYFANQPRPDYITFSGSGEPTLNSGIGEILHFIRKREPEIPTALLTNGTLLSDENLQQELLGVDTVLPSLDAATASAFRQINRPAEELDIDRYIEGLAAFRKIFTGTMLLEVFLLPGYNMDTRELDALKRAIQRIGPDSVQLNTLDRPGTVSGLQAATLEQMEGVIRRWDIPSVEIIAAPVSRRKMEGYRSDTESTILETIARRPCTIEDLMHILGIHENELNKYLSVLEESGRIETSGQERGVFYHLADR